MKLEFLDDAFDGDGLLLLHSGSLLEVKRLHMHVRELALAGGPVRLHALDFIEAADSCELTFAAGRSSHGIQRARDSRRFELNLSPSDWEIVADLLEPFCASEAAADEGTSFQYLHDGRIRLIYSTNRQW